ncbi:MAG TPA: 3-deoxy-D-manno-octulosonic acid transferase [Candidatus Aquilonibacter sp.]|nr:3-deoxy-D-manno-octulosonic acid transferase [Candidatus Aquilonibacter sp.]
MMWLYSLVLAAVLLVSSPWWLVRMFTTRRYREGMRERLGSVPDRLRDAVRGIAEQRRIVWVHAVSVGEVLASSRLVGELEVALSTASGEGWKVVVSTTTRTGQTLARERFGAERVFYFPLDFAWATRAYLEVLRPAALVLMESELWPRMLHECRRAGVPVIVVNARVSDRSFARGVKARGVWGRVLRRVSLWLAQSEDDAHRLLAMRARAESVRAIGNLKYDVRAPKDSRLAQLIKEIAAGRPVVVAGSLAGGTSGNQLSEEELVIQAWEGRLQRETNALLVLAPRHPERFGSVESLVMKFPYVRASDTGSEGEVNPFAKNAKDGPPATQGGPQIVLVDTIGDLAAVYGIADVAFIGGSLVKRGGHNPLEAARFGVPVVMGPSFENFRAIVSAMRNADAIRIVESKEELQWAMATLLSDREAARAMGERGRKVFEEQQGATSRAVEAIVAMIHTGAKP